MKTRLLRYMAIALLFVGSAMLFSCKQEQKKEETSLDAVMTEKSQNLTIVVSENGRRSYRFHTPLLEGYTLGRDPYREFRKGIKIITYQDDSLTTVNATLESNYAIYYENRKLWEAKGNVRVVKHDGTRVYTQQLFWNSTTKRIYSNVDTKIVTQDDTHYTEGFDSDEEMNEFNFRHWKGKVLMKEDMMEQDSTAVDGDASLSSDREKTPSRKKIDRSQKSPTPAPVQRNDGSTRFESVDERSTARIK